MLQHPFLSQVHHALASCGWWIHLAVAASSSKLLCWQTRIVSMTMALGEPVPEITIARALPHAPVSGFT